MVNCVKIWGTEVVHFLKPVLSQMVSNFEGQWEYLVARQGGC